MYIDLIYLNLSILINYNLKDHIIGFGGILYLAGVNFYIEETFIAEIPDNNIVDPYQEVISYNIAACKSYIIADIICFRFFNPFEREFVSRGLSSR